MNESSGRLTLALKKREAFESKAVAGILGVAASYSIHASRKDIPSSAIPSYLDYPPVRLPNVATALVYPLPHENVHPEKASWERYQRWAYWPALKRLLSGIGLFGIPLMSQRPQSDTSRRISVDHLGPSGFLGNRIAFNTKQWPFFEIAKRKYLFPVLNASMKSMYQLLLRLNGIDQPFQVVANDGRRLPAAVTMTSCGSAPAGRTRLRPPRRLRLFIR